MQLANCFAGGAFLSLSLFHLLPEAIEQLDSASLSITIKKGHSFNVAYLLVFVGFSLIFLLERVIVEEDDSCGHNHHSHHAKDEESFFEVEEKKILRNENDQVKKDYKKTDDKEGKKKQEFLLKESRVTEETICIDIDSTERNTESNNIENIKENDCCSSCFNIVHEGYLLEEDVCNNSSFTEKDNSAVLLLTGMEMHNSVEIVCLNNTDMKNSLCVEYGNQDTSTQGEYSSPVLPSSFSYTNSCFKGTNTYVKDRIMQEEYNNNNNNDILTGKDLCFCVEKKPIEEIEKIYKEKMIFETSSISSSFRVIEADEKQLKASNNVRNIKCINDQNEKTKVYYCKKCSCLKLREFIKMMKSSAFFLFLALFTHAMLEGVVVGTASMPVDIWLATVVIIGHKWAEGFSLSTNFIKKKFKMMHSYFLLSIFILASPLGVAIGMLAVAGGSMVAGILNSLAVGTVLYVAIEIITDEFSGVSLTASERWYKYLAYIIGAFFVLGLTFLHYAVGHQHCHGNKGNCNSKSYCHGHHHH